MANKRQYIEENLKKGKRFSKENQPSPEAKSKGHQKRKTMREVLDYLLTKEITNNKGEKATTIEAIMTSTIKKAIMGDVKATQFIRDTIGEMPMTKQQLLGADGEPFVAQKIYITPEELKATDSHIDEVINGGDR